MVNVNKINKLYFTIIIKWFLFLIESKLVTFTYLRNEKGISLILIFNGSTI